MTEVVVDGIIYELESHGGISRMFSEILPRMCDMDESFHITLLTWGGQSRSLPSHQHIHQHSLPPLQLFLRPSRFWEPILPIARGLTQSLYIGNAKGRIWHSTYYTKPYQWGRPSWHGPIVVTVVDMIYEKFSKYFPNAGKVCKMKRECVEQADKIIAISENTKRDIIEHFGIPENKVAVTYLAASDFFRGIPEAHDSKLGERIGINRPFVLYVGKRRGYKNFQTLLKAYSLWKKRSYFDLACVGGERTWSRDEMKLIREANLSNSAKLFNDVKDEELRAFYSSAHAFVYPSLYEGFGIPPLEAMACGTPVVVANTSSIPEVVGDAGLYFEPSSTEELLCALDKIVDSTSLRQELVKRGLERCKKFSWQETAIKTHNVYRGIL